MCRKGDEWICNKAGWLKLCSDHAFAAGEGPPVLRMKRVQGPPWGTRGLTLCLRAQHSHAGKGSGTKAATLPERCFCWSCFFCRRRAGAAVISCLVKKGGFARTSYFQQSTQDCFAVAVRGYSCISSLLLMETELQGCFPHGKEQNGGQPACRFTSYSRAP